MIVDSLYLSAQSRLKNRNYFRISKKEASSTALNARSMKAKRISWRRRVGSGSVTIAPQGWRGTDIQLGVTWNCWLRMFAI